MNKISFKTRRVYEFGGKIGHEITCKAGHSQFHMFGKISLLFNMCQ